MASKLVTEISTLELSTVVILVDIDDLFFDLRSLKLYTVRRCSAD